jgi:hypothetical protein
MFPAGEIVRGGVYAALSFFLAYLVYAGNVAGHKGVLNRGLARIRGLKLAGSSISSSSSSNEAFLLDLETTTGISKSAIGNLRSNNFSKIMVIRCDRKVLEKVLNFSSIDSLRILDWQTAQREAEEEAKAAQHEAEEETKAAQRAARRKSVWTSYTSLLCWLRAHRGTRT